MAVNCPLTKRSVFEEIGDFNENLKSVEDWEYWFRCALLGKYFHFDSSQNTFALVRTHPQSMSTNNIRMIYSSLKARKYINSIIIKLPENDLKNRIKYKMQKTTKSLNRFLYFQYKENNMKWKAVCQIFIAFPITTEYRFIIKELLFLLK
jgi:hypothetical protein